MADHPFLIIPFFSAELKQHFTVMIPLAYWRDVGEENRETFFEKESSRRSLQESS